MAEKRRTFTCKVCGQEHAGLICTKFSGVRVVNVRREQLKPLLLPAPPKEKAPAKPKKAKKAKKKKRTKKRASPPSPKPQAIAAPAEIETVAADIQPDIQGEKT